MRIARRADPDHGGDRRHRHVRRLGRRRGAAPRGEVRRHPVDGGRHGRLRRLPQAGGAQPAHERRSPERPERPPDFHELGYRTALVPIFGARRQRARRSSSAAKLIGKEGIVYAVFVLVVPRQLSLEAGLERGGGARALDPRERADPGPARRHQGPHGPDPHAQSRARRWSTRRSGSAPTSSTCRRCTLRRASSGSAPTATYLLDKRPCRIVIETDQAPLPAGGCRASADRRRSGRPPAGRARRTPGPRQPAGSRGCKWPDRDVDPRMRVDASGAKVRICVAKWGETW